MKPVSIALEVSQDEHFRTPYLKELKESWPSMAKDFRHYCHVFKPKQGDVWIWTSSEGQKFIHFILDEADKKLSFDERLHFFKMALKKLAKSDEFNNFEKVTFPQNSFHFNTEELKIAENLFEDFFAQQRLVEQENDKA